MKQRLLITPRNPRRRAPSAPDIGDQHLDLPALLEDAVVVFDAAAARQREVGVHVASLSDFVTPLMELYLVALNLF